MTDDYFIENMKEIIEDYESKKNIVYVDSEGHLTVGIGHKLTDEEKKLYKKGDYVENEKIIKWFEEDFKKHYKAARSIEGYSNLSNSQKIALIDLTFNMGTQWTTKFPNLIKNIVKYSSATTEFDKVKFANLAANELKYKNPTKGDMELSKYYTQVKSRAEDNYNRLLNHYDEERDDLIKQNQRQKDSVFAYEQAGEAGLFKNMYPEPVFEESEEENAIRIR